MIHVVAHITTKPGKRAAVLELFRANMPAVHAEEGCIEYQPVIDADGFSSLATPLGDEGFMVIEKWSSEATLKAHAASAHMAAYAASTKDLIAEREIYVLSDADDAIGLDWLRLLLAIIVRSAGGDTIGFASMARA